jgi:type VI secretion system protein ImpJ
MKLLSRVVWSEGMHLGPHHFQVQSRYFEDSIQFATSALWFASYGLAGLELDADALYNGSVSLLHARGILPDGLPFNMPECDDLPEPRAIADLIPPTRDANCTAMRGMPPRPGSSTTKFQEWMSAASSWAARTSVFSWIPSLPVTW